MIINGCQFDKDGNIVRKKKSTKQKQNLQYNNVKSRFREHLDYLEGGSASKAQSGKNMPLFKAHSVNEAGVYLT